jgi:hypothetical protein
MKTICTKAVLIAAILMVSTASQATPQGPDTDASATAAQPKPAAAKKKPAKAKPVKEEDKPVLQAMCNFCHQQATQDECVGPNSGACTYPPCGAPTPTNGTADQSKPRLVCYACNNSDMMKACNDLSKKH